MSTLRYNGHSAHYLDSGRGDTVVLLHAGASSSRQWKKMSAELPRSYRLLAPDLIGFGETPAWYGERELTHDDQAELVLALIKAQAAGAVDLVGHSYGGATAIRTVLSAPELVRRLVLIEPIMMPLLPQAGKQAEFDEYERVAQRFIKEADAGRDKEAMSFFIDHRNGPGTWAASSDETRTRLLAVSRQTADGFRSNLNNPTTLADCNTIRAPTLVICGATTTEPERLVTEILEAYLPNCRCELVAEAGHMSPLTHPGEIARLVDEHLAAS